MAKGVVKNSWEKRKLKDICSAFSGRRPSRQSEKTTKYFSTGGEHITDGHRINYEKNYWFISDDFYNNLRAGKLGHIWHDLKSGHAYDFEEDEIIQLFSPTFLTIKTKLAN